MNSGDIEWNFDMTKGQETFKNLFAVTRFRYIDRVSFPYILPLTVGKKNRALYRGLRHNYIDVQFVISFFFFTVLLIGRV